MTENQQKMSVLFVCMGNICRSPTAEAVFRKKVEDAGLANRISVDSAGTHAYHADEPPDRRAQEAASQRGYAMQEIRARRVVLADFEQHELIVAMDSDNLGYLEQASSDESIAELRSSLVLFLEHVGIDEAEVPDPYYGGTAGFERVLDLIEDASDRLLAELRQQLP